MQDYKGQTASLRTSPIIDCDILATYVLKSITLAFLPRDRANFLPRKRITVLRFETSLKRAWMYHISMDTVVLLETTRVPTMHLDSYTHVTNFCAWGISNPARTIFTCSWRPSLCLLRINNLVRIIDVIKQHT